MPSTMNISLPEDLRDYVDGQVRERAFGSTSEYVRELIRKDRDVAKLRNLLEQGAASPVEGEFDAAWFGELRQRIRDRASRHSEA